MQVFVDKSAKIMCFVCVWGFFAGMDYLRMMDLRDAD